MLDDFKKALSYERRNYSILSKVVPETDVRIVECNIWLKQFTAKAVQMQMEAKKTQRELTHVTAERLSEMKGLKNPNLGRTSALLVGGLNNNNSEPIGT